MEVRRKGDVELVGSDTLFHVNEIKKPFLCLTAKTSSNVLTGSETDNDIVESSDSESEDGSDAELTQENFTEEYARLFEAWEKVCKMYNNVKRKLELCQKEKQDLEKQVAELVDIGVEKERRQEELTAELENMRKQVRLLNNGTENFDHILTLGKPSGNRQGLGYSDQGQSSKTIFVKETKPAVSKHVSINKPVPRSLGKYKGKKFIPICHYCNKPGHIRPRCFRKLKDLKRTSISTPLVNTKKVWVRKSDLVCHSNILSLKVSNIDKWYFDSGCSRHLTGRKEFLTDFQTCGVDHVTFGNGEKGLVLGRGNLNVDGLPKLTNVYLVDGLSANFISISQLCDDGLFVHFTENECRVFNDEKFIVAGSRSMDNCYVINNLTCQQ